MSDVTHHPHLPVIAEGPARGAAALDRVSAHDRGKRIAVVALVVTAMALWVGSYFLPYWKLTLFAPQYPNGLRLSIFLTHLGDDAREIDMLNHYIGMAPLEKAAEFERRFAGWGIGLLSVGALALAFTVGKKRNWWIAAAGLVLPVGFIGDSLFWLYRFGHNLDKHAPLRMKPFTPHLFGTGLIGQFKTIALPGAGFWLAVGAFAVLVAAALVRRRVCARCPDAGKCAGRCPHLLLGK